MFKIGDKVKLTRNGRTGVIERISDDIAIIRPDDNISHFTAEMLDRLETGGGLDHSGTLERDLGMFASFSVAMRRNGSGDLLAHLSMADETGKVWKMGEYATKEKAEAAGLHYLRTSF
jgi:hypothetical protein